MEKLTIVLLGKQGAGKSASGNTLLGCDSFLAAASSKQVTRACSVRHATVDQQIIEVIDTPGWGDSSQFDTEMKPNIIKHINQYKPQVFLLVLPIGRFTVEETKTVLNILKGLGDEVIKSMIVLFTKGDDLENRTIEDYLKESHTDLEKIIQICEKRYHVFNNKNSKDRQQITSLLKKINDLVEKNENTKVMSEQKKMTQNRQADNSVPEKIKSPTENGKSLDDQGSTDGKERKELEKLQEFTKENMEKQLKTIKEELKLMQQKADQMEQLQQEQKFLNGLNQKFKDLTRECMKNVKKQLTTMKEEGKPMQQKADPNEQLQQEQKFLNELNQKLQDFTKECMKNMEKQLKTMKEERKQMLQKADPREQLQQEKKKSKELET